MKKLLSLAIVLISASLLRPQMVNVTSSGVGIGTSAPTVTLHVKTDTGVRIEEGTGGPRGLVIEPPDMNSSSNNAKIYTSGTALGMEFGVGGVTMMTLGGSGNVGIGTTTPARLLEIRSPSATEASLLLIEPGQNNWAIGMAASSPDLRFADTNLTNPYLTIQNTSGKVGIGTASPLAQLTVVYDNAAGGGDARGFRLESATGPTSDVLFGGPSSAGDYSYWQSYKEGSGAGVRSLLLNPYGGNVGVGTAAPGYKLTISGDVRGTRFIADVNTYSDFVFKPGYRLASLAEVETAIKKDGHLPGIPSEADAKAHGIDLAEMQAKLLQKVEELTLHMIELKKENDDLRREVEQIKSAGR